MKLFHMIAFCLCGLGGVCADEEPKGKVPTLEDMRAVVGARKQSKMLEEFIKVHGFYENHKRDNSWGSWHGVFLELDDDGISVGIRPSSDPAEIAKNGVALPMGLKPGDSIAEIRRKLGKPVGVAFDPADYYEMRFEGITVFTMGGTLFEVWFMPTKADRARHDALDQANGVGPALDEEAAKAAARDAEIFAYEAILIGEEIYLKPMGIGGEAFGPFKKDGKLGDRYLHHPKGQPRGINSGMRLYWQPNGGWYFIDSHAQMTAVRVRSNGLLPK